MRKIIILYLVFLAVMACDSESNGCKKNTQPFDAGVEDMVEETCTKGAIFTDCREDRWTPSDPCAPLLNTNARIQACSKWQAENGW